MTTRHPLHSFLHYSLRFFALGLLLVVALDLIGGPLSHALGNGPLGATILIFLITALCTLPVLFLVEILVMRSLPAERRPLIVDGLFFGAAYLFFLGALHHSLATRGFF